MPMLASMLVMEARRLPRAIEAEAAARQERQGHGERDNKQRVDRGNKKKERNARNTPIVRGLQHASRVWHAVGDGMRRLTPRQPPSRCASKASDECNYKRAEQARALTLSSGGSSIAPLPTAGAGALPTPASPPPAAAAVVAVVAYKSRQAR